LPLGKKKLLEKETMWNVRLYNKKDNTFTNLESCHPPPFSKKKKKLQ
jgi:hypothetical protein